jgi:hypothetical protein
VTTPSQTNLLLGIQKTINERHRSLDIRGVHPRNDYILEARTLHTPAGERVFQTKYVRTVKNTKFGAIMDYLYMRFLENNVDLTRGTHSLETTKRAFLRLVETENKFLKERKRDLLALVLNTWNARDDWNRFVIMARFGILSPATHSIKTNAMYAARKTKLTINRWFLNNEMAIKRMYIDPARHSIVAKEIAANWCWWSESTRESFLENLTEPSNDLEYFKKLAAMPVRDPEEIQDGYFISESEARALYLMLSRVRVAPSLDDTSLVNTLTSLKERLSSAMPSGTVHANNSIPVWKQSDNTLKTAFLGNGFVHSLQGTVLLRVKKGEDLPTIDINK